MENGTAMAYALDMLQARGSLFISPGDKGYAGQVVGENPRRDDLPVIRPKPSTLITCGRPARTRPSCSPRRSELSIERAIEYIANDELVEVTPNHLRFRKRILDANDRRKAIKRAKDIAAATV